MNICKNASECHNQNVSNDEYQYNSGYCSFECMHHNLVLGQCDYCGIDLVDASWEMHAVTCTKQGVTSCPKGHELRPLVAKMNGCHACDLLMWEGMQDEYGENLKCPHCQSKVESSAMDEGYYEFSCLVCKKSFKIDTCAECGQPDQCSCYYGDDC